MSDTVPNAFLVLLGQIGLFLVALAFGLPLEWFRNPTSGNRLDPETILFVSLILAASLMMVANILIGWSAVRDAQTNLDKYSQRLFSSDLVVILILFGMNNVIIYSFGGSFTEFDPKDFVKTVDSQISSETSTFTQAALLLLTCLYLSTCKVWNNEFYRLRGLEVKNTYEQRLTFVIIGQLVLFFLVFVFQHSTFVRALIAGAWVGAWVLINWDWVRSRFTQ